MSLMLADFKLKYQQLLGNDFDEFIDALSKEQQRFARMNSARGIDYSAEFGPGILEKNLHFDHVYKIVSSDFRFTDSISFQTGGFYIQNPSSLIPVEKLIQFMPDNPVMLDMSAAPGGKTTALSEAVHRKGLIVANEISGSRMKFLNYNLEKYGAWNVQTLSRDGRMLNKLFPETFDGVLLDAPCSNENKIIKTKEVASAWDNELVDRMQKLQQELIISAYDTLKPGGVLVYSTCTFSIEENESIIEHLLNSQSEAELLDINEGAYPFGMSGNDVLDEKVVRVMPHLMDYDGFFIGAVRKKGDLIETYQVPKQNNPYQLDRFFKPVPQSGIFSEVKGICFFEPSDLELKFPRKKSGLKMGKVIRGELEVSSQSVWEFGADVRPEYRIDITTEDAIEYLKGCDIRKSFNNKDSFAVYVDGIPVGTVKHVDRYLKNKLDRFFLYGRTDI